jgi:phosphoglucan,water dikinase
VRGASGDEEVAAAGRHVRGVVLARDLPHLSHLAIRARQEKVPLAATEDPATLAAARTLVGQQVTLTITAGGVTLQRATEAEIAAAKVGRCRLTLSNSR